MGSNAATGSSQGLQTETRPLGRRERKALARMVRGGVIAREISYYRARLIVWSLSTLAAIAVAFASQVLPRSIRMIAGYAELAAAVLGCSFFYLAVRSLKMARDYRSVLDELIRKHSAQGDDDERVNVLRCRATRADHLLLDGGARGWLFDAGASGRLLIHGDDLAGLIGDQPWPNDDFEIVRSADRAFRIALLCRGQALVPEAEASAFLPAKAVDSSAPQELVSSASFEELVELMSRPETAWGYRRGAHLDFRDPWDAPRA